MLNKLDFEKEIGENLYLFHKDSAKDRVWDVTQYGRAINGEWEESLGPVLFSIDGEKIFNLWSDYPDKFTKEEKEIFDAAEPYWAKFFSGRSKK